MGSTLRLRLPVPATTAQVHRLCAELRAQVSADAVTVVVCRVDGGAADLATVDAVARLALAARRCGVAFSVDGPDADFVALLDLVGLAHVLGRQPQP